MPGLLRPDPSLTARILLAQQEARQPLSRDEVAEVVEEVLTSMEGDVSAVDLKIYRELESLADYIQAAREEIAAIKPEEISEAHIPLATDELDAVVGATEEATGRILDMAEQIQTIAEGLDPEPQEKLIHCVTEIFEASNFQDITGQRINKVVKALKHIEAKVEALVGALGQEVAKARDAATEEAAVGEAPPILSDADLMNGPQLPTNAIDQDEIDRLLAEFD